MVCFAVKKPLLEEASRWLLSRPSQVVGRSHWMVDSMSVDGFYHLEHWHHWMTVLVGWMVCFGVKKSLMEGPSRWLLSRPVGGRNHWMVGLMSVDGFYHLEH
jgi:hypothetical protein